MNTFLLSNLFMGLIRKCVVLAFLLVFVVGVRGQVSVIALPFNPTVTNFDAYNPTTAGTATSTIPIGWTYFNGPNNFLGRGTGTGTTGGLYAFGTGTDYSIGALRSGANNCSYTVSFTNNSGATITSITLSWDYEQWRYSNTSGWDCSGTGQLAGNSTLNAQDFIGTATGTNGTSTVTPVNSFTLTGLNIADGQSFGITWITTDVTGADNGISIDNFSISATGVVIPPTITLSSPNPSVPAGTIQQGSINNVLYQLNIGVATSNATLSGLQVSTGGTYAAADIVNLRAWYSADAVFNDATDQLLSTIINPGVAGLKIFPAFASNPTINAGSTGYVFITADVSCTATLSNNIFFNNTTQTNTTFTVAPTYNPDATFGGGLKTISSATPNNVTALTPTAGNTQVALSWTAPAGCYDEIIIVAHTASVTGVPSGTYTAASTSYTNGSNPAFPGGGVVVYNGTVSPQTITSLTNGTLYYFKLFTRRGVLWSSGVEVSATPAAANVATDFFRSNSNTTGIGGNWNTASNWQYSPDNGTTPWQTATLVPNLNSSGINIRSGHNIALSAGSISADQLTVDAGATLTVNGGQLTITNGTGVDLTVNGIFTFSSGNTIYSGGYTAAFGAGAVYNHNVNSGTIPSSTWNPTSTCNITGMIGTVPLNLPQAYGNFIWNCVGQTAFVNLNNSAFSVAGTLTVAATGTSSNFSLVGATTTSYTYNIANINVTGGIFQLNFYSSSTGGTCIVNMSGNITVANSAAAILDFIGGTGAPPVSFSYPTQVNLAGNLTVGLNGFFSVTNPAAFAFGRLAFTGTACDINDPGTSTTNRGFIDFIVNNGATARLQNTLSIFFNSRLEVYGTFDNTAEYQLLDGGGAGTPYIQIDGRFITRDAQGFSGTNAAIPGIIPVLTSGCTIEYGRAGDQAVQSRTDYSNVTFSNNGTKTLASGCNPAGTVYITGAAIFEQSNNTFGNNGTSLAMDGGRYRLSGTGPKPDIGGTYTLTAGVIEFYNSAGTAQTIRGTNGVPSPITYFAIEVNGSNVAQGSANINLASGGSFTIRNGGIFTNNSDAIVGTTGTQTLTIETGGRFVTGNALGFYGAVSGLNSPSVRNNIENVILQTNSTIEYSRPTAQNFTPIATVPVRNYRNVIISGGGTKNLTGAVTIDEILTLTSGMVTTTNTNLLTLAATSSVAGSNFTTRVSGGSDNSFINGPLRKIGNTSFLFPVGKPLITSPPVGGHRYLGISGLSSASDEFIAEFFMVSAKNIGPITDPGLIRVSSCEYWRLDRVSGSTANVTLSWRDRSNCNVAYITELTTLVVAHNTSTSYTTSGYTSSSGNWNSYGNNGGTTGDATTGSVTWNGVSTFSPFALGSINPDDNPLPFSLNSFAATPKQAAITLDWAVGNNHQQQQYIVERSSDGRNFEPITTVNAKQGLTLADYSFDDAQPLNGWNYYRLRARDLENKTNTSSIVKVWWGKTAAVSILPNPASEKIVINLSAPSSIKEIQIVNAMGQVMRTITTVQFFNEVNISSLQAGMYYIRFIGENGLTTKSFVKQ